MKLKLLIPLALFLILSVFLFIGLGLKPREVPSPLIDKPAPAFKLQRLDAPEQSMSRDDMRGKVWLLNVWASWCGPCLQEHPLIVELARQKLVPIVGLNYKNERPDALAWLAKHGDPYDASVSDLDGRVGIDYGVYGVPETFVIDKNGLIRFKQIGPVTPDVMRDKIIPLVKDLQK